VKLNGFSVNFVEICEWFGGCDRLKVILKSRKNKKKYRYISLICFRTIINLYKLK